jgi:hypothetical protein
MRALEKLLSGATGEDRERLQEALERVRKGTA